MIDDKMDVTWYKEFNSQPIFFQNQKSCQWELVVRFKSDCTVQFIEMVDAKHVLRAEMIGRSINCKKN
jgi:hypothetical protein